MADFEKAVEKTLGEEGGYVNDPKDRGGETKFGISKRQYPNVDIENLTLEKAISIYRRDYWGKYGEVKSQEIAEKLFDISVNAGCATANKIAQRALNRCGANILVDGVMGKVTLGTINVFPPDLMLSHIRLEQIRHYISIVDNLPSQIAFLKGWIKRALN